MTSGAVEARHLRPHAGAGLVALLYAHIHNTAQSHGRHAAAVSLAIVVLVVLALIIITVVIVVAA